MKLDPRTFCSNKAIGTNQITAGTSQDMEWVMNGDNIRPTMKADTTQSTGDFHNAIKEK